MEVTAYYTKSEVDAYHLMMTNRSLSTTDEYDPHDAGNDIIVLAEKIKAERAVAGMNKGD